MIFFTWLLLAVLVAAFASSKGRSGIGFFFIAVLLSPVIGFIIALCVKSRDQLVTGGDHVAGYAKCPFCAEVVRAEAVKCKHCGSDLPVESVMESPEDARARQAAAWRARNNIIAKDQS